MAQLKTLKKAVIEKHIAQRVAAKHLVTLRILQKKNRKKRGTTHNTKQQLKKLQDQRVTEMAPCNGVHGSKKALALYNRCVASVPFPASCGHAIDTFPLLRLVSGM